MQVVEGREHEDVHVEVRAAPLLQQLEAQHVCLVGEAAQLPAEDGLGRLHPAQLEQGPARLPPGAARLVRVVEDRAPALRAQRVHRRLDDQVVDQPERLASEVRCQPEDEVQPPRHLLAGEGGGRGVWAREDPFFAPCKTSQLSNMPVPPVSAGGLRQQSRRQCLRPQ